MIALADELHHILKAGEALTAESLVSVLNATGYGTDRVPLDQIELALAELQAAGQVEACLRRGRKFYKARVGLKRDEGHLVV